MIDAAIPLVLALALYGALRRNRGAWQDNRIVWSLAASAGLTSGLRLARVPFDMGLWILIDVLVIAAIEPDRPSKTKAAVIMLLVACWPLYQLYENDNPLAGPAITLIVALQFLLAVPWDRIGSTIWTEKAA